MKTALRSVLLFTALAFAVKNANAQCTVSDLIIQNIVNQPSAPGTCTAKFDISFTIQTNNGNKFIFLHVWAANNYPDYFHCVNGHSGLNGAVQAPDSNDLGPSFINLGINNDGTLPALLTSYPADGTVVLNQADSVTSTLLPDGSTAFVIHGVQATFPIACGLPFLMTADLWSTQAANGHVAQCVNCHINFAINFMSLAGFANCATLTYNSILTNQIGTELTGFYRVYADANFDGVLNLASDSLIRDTTTFTLGAGVGTTMPVNGPIPPVNINQDLFVVIQMTAGVGDGSITVIRLPSTICAALPVTFGAFTARRVNSTTVLLRWDTYTEINNNGFIIERNSGNGWETVGFVPTQAANSSTLLSYSFTDNNTSKAATQYRIKQVDRDERFKYSEIRIVRGFGQGSNLLVYPNPSNNGTVNVVFEDRDAIRDITLIDSKGSLVRQWRSVNAGTMIITNLRPGYYSLRVQDRNTGEQNIAKIVIAGGTE